MAGCVLFIAGMTSCKGNADTTAEDSVNNDSVNNVEIIDDNTVESAAATETSTTADAAMLAAAKEAGQAKCNCYKKDAASVEACIRAILNESYANYKDNEAFKQAMEEEFNRCVKEKATTAAKEAGDKAIKSGAKALSDKLNKK